MFKKFSRYFKIKNLNKYRIPDNVKENKDCYIRGKKERYSFVLTLCFCFASCPFAVYVPNDKQDSLSEDKQKENISFSSLCAKCPTLLLPLKMSCLNNRMN